MHVQYDATKKKKTTYLNKENLNNNEIDKNDFSSPF